MKTGKLLAGLAGGVLLLANSAQAFFHDDDNYTETEHPLVLVHGLFGFDEVMGVEYFYRIAEELTDGGAQVHVAQVSAGNSHEVRGEQLLEQVEEIIATTDADQVNLIGHSQGSPTARYVASVRPDLVASVTSVGGVNWGAPLADEMLDEDGNLQEPVGDLGDAFMGLIDLMSDGDNPQDTEAAAQSLSTEGSMAFNEDHPEGVPDEFCGQGDPVGANGVHYYSWTGTRILTNALDISDPLLAAASTAFDDDMPNDGLVGQCSARLGEVIREDFRMNHLDEVNQVLGLVSLFETRPTTVFRTHANRLQQAGL